MQIFQLLHTLNYGDAISSEALAIDRVLNEAGVDSKIYSINTHPRLKGKAINYREFPKNFSGEIILHYSLGSPLNDLYRSLSSASRTLIYHNITPAKWFHGVNPRVAADIEQGIAELPDLCRSSTRLIADSTFNAQELRALSFEVEILPLMFDPNRWDMPANSGIASLIKADNSLHILHVGRIAPNKKIEDLIKAFYFLRHHIEPNSRLWLAGIDIDTELYSFSLKRLIEEFKLTDRVNFCGGMADDEIRALYENCSVYACMSEHEGFCLPLIEAMHFGIPICAFASSAVPETLGDAGILFGEKNPALVGELMYKIGTDTQLSEQLKLKGKARAASFSFDSFRSRCHELFVESKSLKKSSGYLIVAA